MRTLRFGTQNPAHPWWHIAAVVSERLIGFGDRLLEDTRVALVTPPALQGARWNPIGVSEGELDLAITTPSATARLALDGTGIYDRPYPGLVAIAAYPHLDFLVFAIDSATGIESFEQLVERRYPLRLVTGRRSAGGDDDVLTFTVEEVLRGYGLDYATIEEWGGTVHYGGPTLVGGKLMLDGTAEALFQEAQMTPIWHEIDRARPITYLSVSEPVRRHMAGLGLAPATMPAGHYAGVRADVPTVDFGGWLLFCRDDLPDEIAYAVARACDETRAAVESGPPPVQRSLELPIVPRSLFTDTVVPLHPGAEAYARDRGYLAG
jgi:TRAP-type uncharacterized transport system substrate-binding protein